MGIQINGTNDVISAADGSLTVLGTELKDLSQLNVTGVATAATLVVSGNASIGGTITYMDVSNVDSVGIITAQQGLQVLANGLDVTGVSTFTSDVSIADKIIHTGDTNTAIRFPAADTFTVETAGSERVRIDSNGHLGLGISPSDIDSIGRALNIASSTGGAVYLQDTDSPTTKFGVVSYNGATAALQIHAHHSSSYIDFGTNGTERLRITSAGRVGIGTDSPQRGPLHVHATSAESHLHLTNSSTGAGDGDGFSLVAMTSVDNNEAWLIQRENAAMRFYTNSFERAAIDSSGRLLVGTSSNRTGVQVQLEGTSYATSSASLTRNTNDGGGVTLILGKSRGTTDTSFTVVQNDDNLGSIEFSGADGSADRAAAQINCFVDGTPGSADMPGRLTFHTTADGASSPTERVRIDRTGRVITKYAANGEIDTLSDGATITPDFNASNLFTVTLGGNRTLANPSNITAGQSGSIFVVQDGTGSRTLSFGSYWDFVDGTAPTLTTTASAVDRIDYVVRTSTSIHAVFTANYS